MFHCIWIFTALPRGYLNNVTIILQLRKYHHLLLFYSLYTRPAPALGKLSSNWVTEGSSCPPTTGPTGIQESAIYVSCPSHRAGRPAPWGRTALWSSWHGPHPPPPQTLLISPSAYVHRQARPWLRGSKLVTDLWSKPPASHSSGRVLGVNSQGQDPHLQPALWESLLEGFQHLQSPGFRCSWVCCESLGISFPSLQPFWAWGSGNLGNGGVWGKEALVVPRAANVIVSPVGRPGGGGCAGVPGAGCPWILACGRGAVGANDAW